MKRYIIYISLFILLIPFSAISQTTLSNSGIRAVSIDDNFTIYSWKVDIKSDKDIPECRIYVSLRDKDGFEIAFTGAFVRVTKGLNHFTGPGLCETDIWREIKEFVIQIKEF